MVLSAQNKDFYTVDVRRQLSCLTIHTDLAQEISVQLRSIHRFHYRSFARTRGAGKNQVYGPPICPFTGVGFSAKTVRVSRGQLQGQDHGIRETCMKKDATLVAETKQSKLSKLVIAFNALSFFLR